MLVNVFKLRMLLQYLWPDKMSSEINLTKARSICYFHWIETSPIPILNLRFDTRP